MGDRTTSATLGPEVDRVITTELGHYVGGAVTAGATSRARSPWSATPTGSWRSSGSGRRRSCSHTWPPPTRSWTSTSRPRHIWIHKDRGGPGTAIHEGFHKYASPVLRNRLIDDFRGGGNDVCNLDEGLTEYFTRKVITSAGLGFPRSSYPSQFKSVTKLLTKVSEATLAKAYFDGDMVNAAGGVRSRRSSATSTTTPRRWRPTTTPPPTGCCEPASASMTADDIAAERARALRAAATRRPRHDVGRGGGGAGTRRTSARSTGSGSSRRTVPSAISIYVYEEWGAGGEAGQALTEMVDGDEYYAQSTVNGRLMCFAVTAADSAPGCRPAGPGPRARWPGGSDAGGYPAAARR